MPTRPEPINAIAYAQYHLRGGRKTVLLIFFGALAAIAAIGALALGTSYDQQRTASDGANLLLGIQWAVLGLFATLRVAASVRQDRTGGMIESHRLTPTSPVGAVLGYAIGAAVPLLALALAIGVAGAAFTIIGQRPFSFWLVGNVTAIGAGVLAWTFVTLMSLATNSAGALPGLGLLGIPAASMVMFVPALSVLAAPLAGQNLWNQGASFSLSPAYALTLAADALLAGTFVLAAARKYRSGVADAFNVRLSLLLLALWVAITLIGLGRADLFITPAYGASRRDDEQARLIAALLSGVMVAMLATAAAARAQVMPAEMLPPGRGRWPVPPALAVPLCALLVVSVTLVAPPFGMSQSRQLGTLVVVLAWLASVGFWVAFADLRGRTGWAFVIGWIVATNLLPLLVQGVADANRPYGIRGQMQEFGYAPIGAILNLWGDRPLADAWPGVYAQCGYVLVPVAAFIARRRRDRRIDIPPDGPRISDPPRA